MEGQESAVGEEAPLGSLLWIVKFRQVVSFAQMLFRELCVIPRDLEHLLPRFEVLLGTAGRDLFRRPV